MSDSKPDSVPPGGEPVAPAGAADVDALLDQAARLAAEAAGELGAAEPRLEAAGAPADEGSSSEQVERTLDQVSELVAEANREAAGFAAGSAASGLAQVASVTPSQAPAPALSSAVAASTIPPPAMGKSAPPAATGAGVAPNNGAEPIASAGASGAPDAPASSASAELPQAGALAASGGAAALAPAAPKGSQRAARGRAIVARWSRMLVLAPIFAVVSGLNAPFNRFGDRARFTAGAVAIGTMLLSAVLWLYPGNHSLPEASQPIQSSRPSGANGPAGQ